mmetsp:Transcript_67538/g.162141  ORF Transcript_67538/g.162141 Transcript_67538/m.162141 type:complete len:364 (-) Transcript_67538:36-1127(-)
MTDTDGEERRCCRICLSVEGEDDGLGRLIAPCRCRGTSEFVHQECLRDWIRRQDAAEAQRCPVCRAYYQTALTLRYPVLVSTVVSTTLLRILLPNWHCHLAGAVWLQVVAPLPLSIRWPPWELRNGLVETLGRWTLSGIVCLSIPAAFHHFYQLLQPLADRPIFMHFLELLLLINDLFRWRFLVYAKQSREALSTNSGARGWYQVRDAILGCWQLHSRTEQSTQRCWRKLWTVVRSGPDEGQAPVRYDRDRRLHSLGGEWPAHVEVLMQVLGQELNCYSQRRWLLRVLWIFTEGFTPSGLPLVLAGVESIVLFAFKVLPMHEIRVDRSQVAGLVCNAAELLLAVWRGASMIHYASTDLAIRLL